jgi:hypothetical protein
MLNFKDVILLLQNDYCVEYDGSLIISFFDDDSFESGDGNVVIEFENEDGDEMFDPEAVGKVFKLDEIELSNDIHYLSKIIKNVEDYDNEHKQPKFIFLSLDNNITTAEDVIEHLFDGSFNYSIKELALVKKVEKELTQLKIASK